MISEYYPDSMTLDEYNKMFGTEDIDFDDSICSFCTHGREHPKGCLCDGSLIASYELPTVPSECEGFIADI